MHAWVAPQEVVALHGTFLTAASLVLHLVVAEMAAEADPTWPDFLGLMWATAAWLVAGEEAHVGGGWGGFQVFSWQRALTAKGATPLVTFLRNVLQNGEPLPPGVADPAGGVAEPALQRDGLLHVPGRLSLRCDLLSCNV
jgi:hypothetical protein